MPGMSRIERDKFNKIKTNIFAVDVEPEHYSNHP